MDKLQAAVNWLRSPDPLPIAVLLWLLLSFRTGSWQTGAVDVALLLTFLLGFLYYRYRRQQLEDYREQGLKPANELRLAWRFVSSLWLSLLFKSAWRQRIAEAPDLTVGLLKLVPRLHQQRVTVDGDLVWSCSPGTVGAEVENYQAAAHALTGKLRWTRLLGRRLLSLEIVPTTPGDCRVEASFRDAFEGTLHLKDLPRPTLPNHITYGIRKDGTPAMLNYLQSVLIGGLTRRGKSVVGKGMLACLMWLRVPVKLAIADLKDGIELPEFSKLGRLGDSSIEVGWYCQTVTETKAMLKQVHAEMVRRADVMKGDEHRGKASAKQWIPTPEHPLIIVWLDETIPLKGLLKVEEPIGQIGYVGAGRAVVLWLNSQLGEKEILGQVRDLIPQRISFAVQTFMQTNMILGDSAHLAGALCHKLGKRVGIGYSGTDGDEAYHPFRAVNVTPSEAVALAKGKLPKELVEGKVEKVDPRKRHWLYRTHDDDADFSAAYGGPLAYVGVHTGPKPETRYRQHELAKRGADFKFCKVHGRVENVWLHHAKRITAVEIIGTRADLLAEEKRAIELERPAFNHVHNRGGKGGRRLRALFSRPAAGSPSSKPARAPRPRPARPSRPAAVQQHAHLDGVWSE